MKKFLFAVFLFSQCAMTRAEINCVDSLEWMSVDAPVIVRGKIVGTDDTPGPHSVIYRDLAIQIQEVIKGDVSALTLRVSRRLFKTAGQGTAGRRSQHSFLFFLRKGKPEGDKALAGCWVLREGRQSVIDINGPRRVYKADMTRAQDGDEVLRIVRQWADWKKELPEVGAPNIFKAQRGYLRLDIPPGAEVFPEVYAGSACYINVPAEPAYLPLALSKAQSQSVYERVEGAQMLYNYPGSQTIRLLRSLLYDVGQRERFKDACQLVRIDYPARQAAYETLLALGLSPTKPLMERSPSLEEVRNARYRYWEQTMQHALPDDWLVRSVRDVNEPAGWTRTAGGEGVMVECARLVACSNDKPPDCPAFVVYVMPHQWQGQNRTHPQERLIHGKYTRPMETSSTGGLSSAIYLGQNTQNRHFFSTPIDPRHWPDAHRRLRQYFPLKIITPVTPGNE